MAHIGLTEKQYDAVVDAFSSFDISDHGAINVRDLQPCLKMLGQKFTKSDMQSFIQTLGDPNVIQFEEFLPFVTRHMKGKAKPGSEDEEEPLQPKAVGTRRRIVNWLPFIIGMTLPWALLVFVFSINSFRAAFTFPGVTRVVTIFTFLTVLYLFYRQRKKRSVTVPCFIGGMCVISTGLGWLLGNVNFWMNMHTFYELQQMATYMAVNPSRLHQGKATTVTDTHGKLSTVWQDAMTPRPTEGKRYQDAGKVFFSGHNIAVDVSKTVSFKSHSTYCVAPIVDTNCQADCGHDFWAVGLNCCGTEDQVAFSCNGVGSNKQGSITHKSKSGVRWLGENEKPYFRLAVLEAEGIHKIKSAHPLFFTFYDRGEDPDLEVGFAAQRGFANLFILAILSMVINIAVMLILAKKVVKAN